MEFFNSVNNKFSSGFKLLIFFLVIFSFIRQTTKTKKAKLLISKHSTNYFLTSYSVPSPFLLYLTQVSKIMLSYLLHMFIYIQIKSRKPFIIPLVSLLLKLSYSLSGVVLNKPFKFLKFPT